MLKRVMSFLLALLLVVSLLPASALAADIGEPAEPSPAEDTPAPTEPNPATEDDLVPTEPAEQGNGTVTEQPPAVSGSTAGTAATCTHGAGSPCPICPVEILINSVSTYDDLAALEGADYYEAMKKVRAAEEAYKALTSDQQALVGNSPRLTSLLGTMESLGEPCYIAQGTEGTITWKLTKDYTLTVSGTGEISTYNRGTAPWYLYQAKIQALVVETGITGVGDFAFAGCAALTSVTLADSVVTLGDGAFCDCTGLKNVELSPVTEIFSQTFSGCTALEEILIPQGVTYIDMEAFYGCTSLQKVTLPGSLGAIDSAAFYQTALKELVIPDGVEFIGDSAFGECTSLTKVVVAESVTQLDASAFAGCTALQEVTLMGDQTSLGAELFSGARNLSVYIPNGLEAIDPQAFAGCKATVYYDPMICDPDLVGEQYGGELAWLDINDQGSFQPGGPSLDQGTDGNITWVLGADGTLTLSGTGAMKDYNRTDLLPPWESRAASIHTVVLGEGITTLGDYAFDGCTGLKNLYLPASVTTIGAGALTFGTVFLENLYITSLESWCAIDYPSGGGSPIYQAKLWLNGQPVTDLVIPASVTVLKNRVFSGCASITSLVIPATVTTIEANAVSFCPNLKELTIAGAVADFHPAAFQGNQSLTKVTFGNGLTTIPNNAFGTCTALEEIRLPETVKTIESYAFSDCTGLKTIYLPSSLTAIGTEAFYGVTAVVRYDRATFPAALMDQYGGNLTWKDLDEPCVESTLENGVLTVTGQGEVTWQDIDLAGREQEVRSLVIGEGITAIPDGFFADCTNLTSVSLPASFERVNYGSLNMPGLKTIQVAEGNPYFAVYDGILYSKDRTKLYHIPAAKTGMAELKKETTEIALGSAFDHVKLEGFTVEAGNPVFTASRGMLLTREGELVFVPVSITGEVTLPAGVKTIGYTAFTAEPAITALHLGADVADVGTREAGSLFNLKKLQSITVDENNPLYTAQDGVLYSKDMTAVAYWPEGMTDTLVIPDSVTNVGDNTVPAGIRSLTVGTGMCSIPLTGIFYGTMFSQVETITVRGQLPDLSRYELENLTQLTTLIFLGEPPANMGSDVFAGRTLTVYYPSGSAAWESIAGSSFGGNITCQPLVNGLLGSGQFGSLTWELTPEGLLTISGFGNMPEVSWPDYAPWYSLREKVTKVVIGRGVTGISGSVFQDCSSMTELHIPSTVTSLQPSAFSGCTGMERLYLEDLKTWMNAGRANQFDGFDLYLNGSLVEHLVIPESIDFVSEYAFYGCRSLKSVTWSGAAVGEFSQRGIGPDAFAHCVNLEKICIPDQGTVYPFSISYQAFLGCTALKDVKLPSAVTLWNKAFSGCTALKEITIPSNQHVNGNGFFYDEWGTSVFENCTALETVRFAGPNSQITAGMFSGCVNLRSVELSSVVSSIGDSAFLGCTALTSIRLPESLVSIGNGAFMGCSGLTSLVIPGGVASIGSNAFVGTGITGLEFQGDPPTVGSTAFMDLSAQVRYPGGISQWQSVISSTWGGARSLTWTSQDSAAIIARGTCGENITWTLDDAGVFTVAGSGEMTDYSNNTPWRDDYADQIKTIRFLGSITSIGSYAFTGCTNLESVTIPETVEYVQDCAFQNCRKLKELVIPGSITLWTGVFQGCTALESVSLELTEWSGYDTFQGCTGLTTVTLREGSLAVGNTMFADCTRLVNVNLPGSLRDIAAGAFNGCTALKQINIPKGVTFIGARAFGGCTDLSSVAIPDGVPGLTEGLFAGCTSLTTVTIPASVTEFDDPFRGCTNLKTLKFNGKAPAFRTNSLQGLTLTAYYPQKYAESWASARQNYGGKITWIAYSEQSSGITADGMTWELSDTGVLTIRGGGAMTDYIARSAAAPWLEYADRITEVILEGNITHVGAFAFQGCVNLQSVTLPNTLKTVGVGAFRDCTGLKTVCYGGDDTLWAAIEMEEGNDILSTAKRILPNHIHVTKNVTHPAVAATNETPGHKAYTVSTCQGCGEWLNAKKEPMTQAEKNAFLSKYLTYVKVQSFQVMDAYGNPVTHRSVDLARETSLQLTTQILPAGAKQTVTWTSSNARVAKVDENGFVTFLQSGTVNITARGADGKQAVVKLTLSVWPQGVSLTAPEMELRSGKNMSLAAIFQPLDTTNKALTWSVSDPNAAAITSAGRLSAKTVYEETPITVTAISKENPLLYATLDVIIQPKNDTVMAIHANGRGVTAQTVSCDIDSSYLLEAFTFGEHEAVTWKVSSANAAIDENGYITFKKAGSYTVTATASDKRTAKVTFRVSVFAKDLEVTSKTGETHLASGKKLYLVGNVTPANTANKRLTWAILEGGEYAKVSSSGAVTANRDLTEPQVIKVQARTADGSGLSDVIYLTLHPIVSSVTISQGTKGKLDLSVTDTMDFDAQIAPAGAIQGIQWKVNNQKLARIDENGRLTALKPGTVVVTATATDGSNRSARYTLTLVKTMTGLEMPTEAALAGGKTLAFKPVVQPADTTNKKLTWTVDNTDYATIASNGVLRAKAVTQPQVVTVTATAQDGGGALASCQVTIYPASTKVNLSHTAAQTLPMGSILQLSASVAPAGAYQGVQWTSSNQKVATVDENGLVTPLKPGTVSVTAKTADGTGRSASVRITVIQQMESLSLQVPDLEIAGGRAYTFRAAIAPAAASNKKLTWTLDDTAWATISGGVLRTKPVTQIQTVTVICSANDGSGLEAVCLVTIYPKAAQQVKLLRDGVAIAGTSLNGTVGETVNLGAEVTPADASQQVTWASSNQNLATVDSQGRVTLLKAGTVTITARAADGSGRGASIRIVISK